MTVLRTAYVEVMPKTDKFEPELNKRIRRIDASAAAGSAGEQAGESFGTRMAGAVTTAFAAAGIGGVLAGAVTASLDVSGANDKLRAQLNLTAEESARLGKAAGELYSNNYGESMGEVNTAIAKVLQAVPSLRNASVPVLKEIASGALDIARVFDQDVGGVTSAVSSMLRSGLAPNAQAAMDLITKGLQSGADKGGDFLDTLTEYSVQFTKLGLDGPAALGVINQLLAGGARNSDLAADAIKEFSIRAIDGSKTSAEGFKAIGVNAGDMAKAIASGGPAARTAFGEVVERLNAMQDPVKRNQAGVALFGTQWEDLGDAFRKLDVSAATDGLGKVAGATKGIADQSDQGRINGFVRSLKTGFVNVVGGEVLPRVTEFIDKLKSNKGLMDGLRSVGDKLVGTLSATASTAGDVVRWFREHETVTKTLAVAVGALLVATQAHAAVLAVQAAGGLVAYITQIRIVSAVTKAWAAVQWIINAAMSANPVGLIIIGLLALGAALVVAYQKSDTFRAIVQAAWKGIQVAVSFAWNNIIKPAVAALVWYFKNVMAPTFLWLYNNVVKPVWAGIQLAVKAAWVVIQIILAGMKMYFERVIAPVFRFLWNNVVKPVFAGIAATISAVWNKGIKPVFEVLGGFIKDKVAPAFRSGVGAIAAAWDKVKDAASKPVRFVIDQVLNQGIIGGINWLASKVGVKDRIPPIRWGGGGGSKKTGDAISGNTKYGDGYGHRHGTGDGEGIGDGLGSLLTNPGKWLADRAGIGKLAARFGNNPFVKTLTGAVGRAKNFALEKVQSLVGEFLGRGGGGSVGAGGLRTGISGALAALRATFGSVPLISGVRPGATTLTGNRSYHADGRAIDIAPVRPWAEYLNRTYRGQLKELITPWQDLNLLNGRPHQYRGAVWQQHNFAGGNAHVHAAMANGGIIHEPVFGIGRSGRTYAFGERGPETVTPGVGGGQRTYSISVQVAPTAHPAEVGRQIVESIKAFEAGSGSRWRR
ncbi:phage tail tape measure protein [Micromonospora sp. NBC_01740]|uniref:phage tail tape measure protein n=1 Tax=Micromonospora sp. NBC_01740 TaxID=2975986 RepID=UPI002E0F2C7B|nr:phage tail tape measure protein [Micromonospora sp. NBC_01740]